LSPCLFNCRRYRYRHTSSNPYILEATRRQNIVVFGVSFEKGTEDMQHLDTGFKHRKLATMVMVAWSFILPEFLKVMEGSMVCGRRRGLYTQLKARKGHEMMEAYRV
jgi:hypothetical protein